MGKLCLLSRAAFLSQYDIHIQTEEKGLPFVVVIASMHYTLTEERNKRPIFVYVNLDRWALLSPSGKNLFPPLLLLVLINASILRPPLP